MNVKILILNFVLLTSYVNGQKWEYNAGNNAFDGNYKTATIIGKGGLSPYNTPGFIINMFEKDKNSINVYLVNAGYAGCDNKRIYLKFDKNEKTYSFDISTNKNNGAWFLDNYYETDADRISIFSFLEKMKIHSKMYIRAISDCGQADYEFSLLGSSSAIDFVALEYITRGKVIEKSFAKAKEKERKEKLKNLGNLFSKERLKTKAKYNGTIYFISESNDTIRYSNLKMGEDIVFSGYSEEKDYCILHKATTLELPVDTVFYITKHTLILENLEKVEK